MGDAKRLLLHSCCGPCSTAALERLREEYEVTLFFYNPNITEEAEYRRRLEAQGAVMRYEAALSGKALWLEGDYEPPAFLEAVRGLEGEPEGGGRCAVCFRLRLEETARQAAAGGYDCFTTTLSVSPHKDYALLCRLGRELGEKWQGGFLEEDFKKKNGYGRSVELSKGLGLYRQDYCGCEFSKRIVE